jgi:hypothetical protein
VRQQQTKPAKQQKKTIEAVTSMVHTKITLKGKSKGI